MPYAAPLADMHFVLETMIGYDHLTALPGCQDYDREAVDAILTGAGELCGKVLAPLNAIGDSEGCRFSAGTVRLPVHFHDAYRRFRDGGWVGLGMDPAHGGQGLPRCLDALVTEMICAANLSFGITPGLSAGAYRTLKAHAAPDLAAWILPHLASGAWSGTMCLTEPHCGTDLGMVRTRALPATDGAWHLTGAKIFASAGEHDLTDNIVHLVLARTPDAPAGTAGLSLFVVPKLLADGRRNTVICTGIERKMGLHASPTCTLAFDGATGWLVGDIHHGMRAMFTMMNEERLSVGLQGLGLAEAASQRAHVWARERLQGRATHGPRRPDLPADPLVVHPDIRRMLLTLRATTEGMRALAAWVAWQADLRDHSPDPMARAEADDFVQLMTPIIKALFTDLGFAATNLGLQIMGGHGYIADNGMEQLVRDARIGQIYEGSNGIQALDLVGRKLPAHMGRLARRFFHPVQAAIDAMAAEPALSPFAPALAKAFARLQRTTAVLARAGLADPDEAAAGATDYLRLFGLVALCHVLAAMAKSAQARDDAIGRSKLSVARFFFTHLLPETAGLAAAILAGGKAITEPADEVF